MIEERDSRYQEDPVERRAVRNVHDVMARMNIKIHQMEICN